MLRLSVTAGNSIYDAAKHSLKFKFCYWIYSCNEKSYQNQLAKKFILLRDLYML